MLKLENKLFRFNTSCWSLARFYPIFNNESRVRCDPTFSNRSLTRCSSIFSNRSLACCDPIISNGSFQFHPAVKYWCWFWKTLESYVVVFLFKINQGNNCFIDNITLVKILGYSHFLLCLTKLSVKIGPLIFNNVCLFRTLKTNKTFNIIMNFEYSIQKWNGNILSITRSYSVHVLIWK